jgi:hypothetical protein
MLDTVIQDQIRQQALGSPNSSNNARQIREQLLEVVETVPPTSLSDIKAKVTLSVNLAKVKQANYVDPTSILESPEAKMKAIAEGRKMFNQSDVGYSGHSQVYYKKDGKVMMGDCEGTAESAYICYDVMRKF